MRHGLLRSLAMESTVMNIRRAATPRGRARLGCFSIEGLRLHERAVRAGVCVEAVVVGETLLGDPNLREKALVDRLRDSGCRVSAAPDALIDDLTEGRSSGALVGLVRMPERQTLREVIAVPSARRKVFLVAVEVEDPGNFGALARTVLASGAVGLIGVGVGDLYHPKAVRTSMGSVFKLPRIHYETVDALIADTDELGVRKFGAVSTGGTLLPEVRFGDDAVAVFVGSEAFGLSPAALAAMDGRVTVPMAGGVDSLSVNAAAAVILYEACGRQ